MEVRVGRNNFKAASSYYDEILRDYSTGPPADSAAVI